MASTYSDLKFELIGTGEQSGTWGTTTNTNIGTAIQEAITGSADVTFTSGNVTLTLTNTNTTQAARNLRLNCTGTTGGARDLIVPNIEKFYLVNNGCADAITVKNSTGTGVAVPAGKAMLVFNNATNVVDAVNHLSSLTLATALAVAQGGTGATTDSGARTNLGLGTIATQAANNVSITGGSVTGITDLAVADGGTGASDASTARTNLGLAIGTNVQAYDADLTAIGGLAKTDGNIIVGNGSTWVAESGATARTSLGLGTGDSPSFAGLTVDTDTLYVDAASNEVGIGTATPAYKLDVSGVTKSTSFLETVYAVSGTTPAIAATNGNVQTWTLSGNSTPTDSLNAGESITLMIDDGSAYTITWTSLVDQWIGGSAPTLATTGYSVVELWKVSTTVYGAYVGDAS